MNLSSTWKLHYANLASNEAGNVNMAAFGPALAADIPFGEKLRALTEDPDTVILAAGNKNQVIVFHSPCNFGGKRFRTANKVGALMGFGPVAGSVIVDENTLTAECEIVSPTIDELVACSTAAEVEALPIPSARGAVTFQGSATYLPAPFLRDAIINLGSSKPSEIIPVAVAAAKEFDRTHANDPDLPDHDEAMKHVEAFVMWVWGVGVGRITESRYFLEPEDGELHGYSVLRHKQCIMPPLDGVDPNGTGGVSVGGNAEVLRMLHESISRQNEESSTANDLRREELRLRKESQEGKKDRLKDLHESTVNMLLMASATDPDAPADELVESAKRFINSRTAALADHELHEQFEDLNITNVCFAHGLVNALYAGCFLWFDKNSPNNFSPFCFSKCKPLQTSQQARFLLLHLISTQGQGKTMEECKATAKQSVIAPMECDDLFQQVRFFGGACSIFFGPESIGTEGIKKLFDLMNKYRTEFENAVALDPLFASKLLFAFDNRFQRWMVECKRARDRSEVNDRIINFSDIIDDVLNRRFVLQLPPSFREFNPTDSDAEAGTGSGKRKVDSGEETPGGPKKPKKEGVDKGPVHNQHQLEDFKLKEGESWKDTFCGKCVDERPVWNGKVKMCPRWHIKGVCFKNCHHAESHVPKDRISDEKRKEFLGFMKKCRKD